MEIKKQRGHHIVRFHIGRRLITLHTGRYRWGHDRRIEGKRVLASPIGMLTVLRMMETPDAD